MGARVEGPCVRSPPSFRSGGMLIYQFGVDCVSLGSVVAFINQNLPTFFPFVPVGCTAPRAHQENTVPSAQPEIHAALQHLPLGSAHFVERDDVPNCHVKTQDPSTRTRIFMARPRSG